MKAFSFLRMKGRDKDREVAKNIKCFLFSVKCVTKCPLSQIHKHKGKCSYSHTRTYTLTIYILASFITLHSLNLYFCFFFCLVQSSMTDFAATNSAAQSLLPLNQKIKNRKKKNKKRKNKTKTRPQFAQALFALLCRRLSSTSRRYASYSLRLRLLLLVPLCLLNTQGQRQRKIIKKKVACFFAQNAIAQIISIN